MLAFLAKPYNSILPGLRSLDSVNGTNRYGKLMEKLSAGSSDFMVGNQSVLIDLSSSDRTLLSDISVGKLVCVGMV